jgi:nicotinamidase-related amidase
MDLERQSLGLGRRPALILVDLIEGFTNPDCPLGCDCPDVVAANATILAAFRDGGLPVFFTTVIYRDDSQARVFRARLPALNVLVPDSRWVKVDARLAPAEGELVIEKQWASAFHGTDIDTRLRQRHVDSLVVTGLSTSGCVRATAVDGLQYDYPVVVPREAVGDRNANAHAANLFDLHAKYADVCSVADVTAHLAKLQQS